MSRTDPTHSGYIQQGRCTILSLSSTLCGRSYSIDTSSTTQLTHSDQYQVAGDLVRLPWGVAREYELRSKDTPYAASTGPKIPYTLLCNELSTVPLNNLADY